MTDELHQPDGHWDLDMLLQSEAETLTHAALRAMLHIRDAADYHQLIHDLNARWEPTPAAQLTLLLNAIIDAVTNVDISLQTPEAN